MTGAVLPRSPGGGLGRMLVQGVAKDLTRRGVRAIEAFGARTAPSWAIGDRDDPDGCLVPADFLLAVGFKTVRPHHRVPAAAARAEDRAVLARGRRARAGAHPRHGPGARCWPSTLSPCAPLRPGPSGVQPVAGRASARGGRAAITSSTRSVPVGRRAVLGEVQPLDGGHDRLGAGVPERRVGQAARRRRGGQVADARPGPPASGSAAAAPRCAAWERQSSRSVRATISRCTSSASRSPGGRSAHDPVVPPQ